MSNFEIAVLFLLAPLAVWVLARVTFAAFFAAKAAYLRRFFHATGETQNGRGDGGP